jgi:hypothetical protein
VSGDPEPMIKCGYIHRLGIFPPPPDGVRHHLDGRVSGSSCGEAPPAPFMPNAVGQSVEGRNGWMASIRTRTAGLMWTVPLRSPEV